MTHKGIKQAVEDFKEASVRVPAALRRLLVVTDGEASRPQ